MKSSTCLAVFSLALLCASPACADVFGSDENTFEIEFITVGNPGNDADTTGSPNPAGTVDYEYRIGKYEISEAMIDKANALGDLGITHKIRSPNQPATAVNWNEVARFVNWLSTSTGSAPAYKFDAAGTFVLWEPGDDGYDPDNLFRNSLARYFVPSTQEWYKAAYYDPVAEVYYDYPTGSNFQPDGLQDEDDPEFDAVFYDGDSKMEPNDVTNVGITSPYGTAGQGGNVAEMTESAEAASVGHIPTGRFARGGQWDDTYISLRSNIVGGISAASGADFVGFRVASQAISFMTGDYNRDGFVDELDYNEWRETFGTFVAEAGLGADGNGDLVIDAADYTVWRDSLELMGGSGAEALAPVPEPTAIALAAMAMLALAVRDRRGTGWTRR